MFQPYKLSHRQQEEDRLVIYPHHNHYQQVSTKTHKKIRILLLFLEEKADGG